MENFLLRQASKIRALPLVGRLSPAAHKTSEEDKEGFRACQRLAQAAAKEVASLAKEGWTEIQAAKLLETYLLDQGVEGFFHHSFAWFGERARFDGIGGYGDYSPSRRVLLPNEIFILDVAPIYKGYICDIGFTACLGENARHKEVMDFLRGLREQIPGLFREAQSGGAVWKIIDERVTEAGYDNVHKRYPFSVLGHRLYRTKGGMNALQFWNFGWQSYWELMSRGLFGQLLNQNFSGKLDGLWAIEPHVGGPGFGAKFEEILVVEGGDVRWLDRCPF